jgi:hypothetical protein
MNVNKPLGLTSSLKMLASLTMVGAILVCSVKAGAQQWKDALITEEVRNSQRQDAIEKQGAPIAASLRQNTAKIDRHNAHPCTYPDDHPEVCSAYTKEKADLETERDHLVSQLQPLADEIDRLTARNQEIERRLKCVSVPRACKSDSDCEDCSSCATFSGSGQDGVCQPLP